MDSNPIKIERIRVDKFKSLVGPPDKNGCQRWLGYYIKRSGYGNFFVHPRNWNAHRVAWIIENGSDPAPLHILHSCDNRWCVAAAHLRTGTHQDNMRDMSIRERYNKQMFDPEWQAKYRGTPKTHWKDNDPEGFRKHIIEMHKHIKRGEKNQNAKHTDEQIRQVKRYISQGFKTRDISEEMGISKYVVNSIRYGEAWGHITI